jgi:hypothetical protein
VTERSLTVPGRARNDLAAFITHLVRTDESAVLRVRRRSVVDDGAGEIEVWGATGFGVLAMRVLPGAVTPDSLVCSAGLALDSLRADRFGPDVDAGYSMDSAWRGALPPVDGYRHLEDVPAVELIGLAERGVAVGRSEAGPLGLPPSLLDSAVVTVSGVGEQVVLPLRLAFALSAMGFTADGDPVRVRASATWIRVDARYGSLYQRREAGPRLLV